MQRFRLGSFRFTLSRPAASVIKTPSGEPILATTKLKGGEMISALSALLLSDDSQLSPMATPTLEFFGIQPTWSRTSQSAMDLLRTRKFDLLVVDVDIEGISELANMSITNGLGYRTTVIALAENCGRVWDLLAKRIHFVVLKPLSTGRIEEGLASACRLILIEKRVSFRHGVMINADASVLANGAVTTLTTATVLDISQTGFCMKTVPIVANGASVFVNYLLPGTQDCIHTIGKVMWVDIHGRAGVSLQHVPPQEFKRLRNYLNERCPWSEVLARIPDYAHANSLQSPLDMRESEAISQELVNDSGAGNAGSVDAFRRVTWNKTETI